MIRVLGTVFAALLGLAFGSFLNVCLSRWPEGESIVRPGSHCRSCGRALPWWENVPLASWLVLRGRCHGCGQRISWRYPLVELAVGVLWAIPVWRLLGWPSNAIVSTTDAFHGISLIAGALTLSWILVALAMLDAEHLWLPDRLTWPGIALGLGFYALQTAYFNQHAFENYRFGATEAVVRRLLVTMAAGGAILLIRWIYWLVRRQEGMGLGDAKLMALLAAWLGGRGALLSFAAGVVLGAATALVLLLPPKTRSENGNWAMSKLPLGTFLCIGGIVSSLWGEPMVAAYLRWAGF